MQRVIASSLDIMWSSLSLACDEHKDQTVAFLPQNMHTLVSWTVKNPNPRAHVAKKLKLSIKQSDSRAVLKFQVQIVSAGELLLRKQYWECFQGRADMIYGAPISCWEVLLSILSVFKFIFMQKWLFLSLNSLALVRTKTHWFFMEKDDGTGWHRHIPALKLAQLFLFHPRLSEPWKKCRVSTMKLLTFPFAFLTGCEEVCKEDGI